MFFFTATINSWQLLLADDVMKKIVGDSLLWMHQNNRARTHGFVIMPNHIHLLWSPVSKFHEEDNERTLLSFTGHAFKKHLQIEHPEMLNQYVSTQKDREFHFWERRSRTIEVMSRRIAEQKLDYIHFNPISGRWRLASSPEGYFYSSASYYILNKTSFSFITHYMDYI